jgi:phytoene synthase
MRDEWLFPNRATPVGSSAYYSVRFAPAELRVDLAALIAWRHQVQAILHEVSDPGVARLKLQWWREELERTDAGRPRHPLSQVLAPVLARHHLPVGPFLQMAGHVEAEILRRQPPDEDALTHDCERDLGALFDLMARCHGISDPQALAAARRLGAFCARVYLIRDGGALARAGRALLPQDRLHERGLSAEALRERGHRARLATLLGESAQRAQALLADARATADLPLSLRVRARILEALLGELTASGFAVAEQGIRLTALRKLWLAWRESRRG